LAAARSWVALALLGLGSAFAAGCAQNQAAPPPAKPVTVKVSVPVVKEVTDYEEFVGRTEACKMVEIRARVTGYLNNLGFRDGALVEKGKVLFKIDPRPFQADLDKAEAAIAQNDSRRRTLEYNFQRAADLLPGRAMSREDFDKVAGDLDEAKANLNAAVAARDRAKINLEWTKVLAPVSGLVSRRFVDEGNLVKADDTLLTTIVCLDPMYAYFDVDEATILKIQRLTHSGQIASVRDTRLPVSMGLADEEGFPHKGEVDFVDNRLNGGTGTLQMRGVFPNASKLLTPNLFVRVRLQVGKPHQAILMTDRALGTDQGLKFLYVVNAKNEVEYRSVQTGAVQDELREMQKGLAAGERVVVSGLQRVRPGLVVEPEVVAMPTAPPDASAKDH
jgi:RND family efflux transporter MFP subunit